MDDDFDNYIPQISTMDYNLLAGGNSNNAGSNSGGSSYMFEGGQQPGASALNQNNRFANMIPGTNPQQQQQYPSNAAATEYSRTASQGYPPGFVPPPGAVVPPHIQMAQHQMATHGHFPHGYGMPPPNMGKPPQPVQQQAPAKSKSKKSKKVSAITAEGANPEHGVGMIPPNMGQQQHLPPHFQQMGGYYYKNQPGPSQQMSTAMIASPPQQQDKGAQKWHPSQYQHQEEQQKKEQQFQQQMAQHQQSNQQQQYAAQHPPMGTQMQQHQSAQQQQAIYSNSGQQQYPGYPQPPQHQTKISPPQQQKTKQAQQQPQYPQQYYGQQQQPQQYAQQQMQQQQSGQYPGMGMPPQGVYPYPHGAAEYAQQQTMQRQAFYAHQQQMMAAAPSAANSGTYYQPPAYMNAYMAQQQQIYRELFECDQQFGALMAQGQQTPEMGMRIEKLQIHRGYLQSQLMHLQQHAAAAAAQAGIPPGAIPTSRGEQQPPTGMMAQYPPYPGGQQAQSSQHQAAAIPVQQKLPPSSYAAPGAPAQYPQAPQAQPNAAFHSPSSGVTGAYQQQPVPPHPQHQPQQQQQQVPPQIAQQQQQQSYPAQHLASPSVAVMSASNQVQVNIVPEMPGRTLISVYHSQDIPPTAVVTSTAMQPYSVQSDASAQSLSAKDSIPPEPLPPNIAQEQKRRKMQQQRELEEEEQIQQAARTMPPLPSQQMIQFEQKQRELQQQEEQMKAFRQRVASHPPQPKQVNIVAEAELAQQHQQRATDVVEVSLAGTPPSFVEVSVARHFAAPNCYLTAECSINVPIAEKAEPLTLSTVEVEEKMVEEQVEQEHQKKDEEERSSILREVKLEDMATSEMDQLCEMPVTESSKTLAGQEIPTDVEMENLTVADSTSDQKTPFGVDAETLSVSTSDAFLSKLDDKEDSTADDSVCPGTGASSSTKETTPMPMFADDSLTANTSEQAASSSQLASYSLSASAGAKSKSRSKKRRQSLDWNRRDEDDDYVGGKKKRRKSVKREVSMDPADELDEDLLMEKRRSTRKQPTGKKAKYGVDSEEDDFEEGAKLAPQQEMALAVEPVEERIVEKILGVRFGKRRVRKEKESQKEGEKEPQEKEDEQKEKDNEGIKEGEVDAVEQTKDDVEKLDTEKATEREEKITEVENGNKEEKNMEENGESKNGEEQQQSEKRENDVEEEEIEVEELYVKYKNFSYLHCEWKTIEELDEMGDKRVIGKLNRYKQKFGETTTVAGEDDEQEYFNEDFTVVTRVLDETYDEGEQQHYVYVKWKALSYDDCTWELLQNVPENKVAEYRQRAKFDPCKAKEMSRLSPNEFAQVAVPKDKVYKNDNMLREYQHEGVNWLLWTWANARNCILADEMGLGKTVQTIAFFQSIYDTGIHGPFLVVVPLSTLSNWEREFENWTDINAIVYHGGAPSRQIIQNCEFYYKDKRKNVIKFDAMITTYEVVVQEVEVLKRINFRVCVIDEAHRIKNRNCKLLQSGLLSLKMEHRVLLTGTPLQNNIQELFSLLNFLEPEQFANSEAFLQQFGQCQTEDQVQKLQEILKPMMLRRLKEDVEKELQPKEETIIEVQLSNIQKKYYRAVLERNFTHLMKGTTPSLINTMMQLRKCCNHPYLINGAEEQILAELKQSHPEKAEDELQTFGLISSSGKLVLIDKLLPKLHADGHKVLIFSQMVRVLDLLEEYLSIKSYPFERIDGNIRGNERQAAIDRFSRPENNDRFVFLLCTRAGGLGINLTAADTVIIFDSDWNPQNDLQAQARCHRIGQTKPVKIYRLITSNSYEREMFDKASLKLGLDKAVLQSMLHKSDNSQQMSRQEVEDLLRKGAYGAIMDEDNEGTKFSEEDIDTILLRRTQTIRLEPGVKGSTFAKASFTSSHNREDIDIQDPDFWSKWAKKANIDMDALNDDYSGKHLIVHEPRSRKKRFEAENLKGNSESGEEGFSEEDDRSQSTPNKIADGVKNRSAKRRRRGGALGEYDEDYPYKPDELAFNKSSYFKVEKLLTQFGWGRWAALKAFSDLTEQELEHISRTLLLNCVREFRGDEKIREYVWKMITPSNETAKIREKSGGTDGSNKYHQGWAALPEYNPPFICVDASFQRHLHRHSNKLLNRMHQLHFLTTAVIQEKAVEGVTGEVHEMNLELPENVDNWLIMPNWDRDCDRDLLVGVYKHGMENWEQVHADAKLCFSEKNVQFPTTLDLNNRFKYLVSMLQKRAEASTSSAPKTEIQWSKVEESDFMRILRNYGVKDDTNSENVINWGRFRELSICLQKKTDGEMLEMLYCVLAMCTKQQGGVLSTMDERRAERVDSITAKAAEKLMNRLHLMRKVHAIITMGIQNIRGMLKMVSLDVMPKGWTEAHDEHLLIVVDKFGLEDIHGKVKLLPKLFESISPIDENLLLRRVVEICITLETGKWSGPASIEMLQDGNESLMPCTSAQAAGTAKAAQKNNSGSGNTRKKVEPATGRRAQSGTDKLGIAGGSIQTGKSTLATGKNMPSMNYSEQQALLKMMEQMANPNYLLSLMSLMNPGTSGGSSGSAASSSSSAAALQQQFQQLQTLLTLSALGGADPNLASIGASLAGMMPPTTNSSAQKQSTALDTKTDALNLSKRGEVQKATTPVSKVAKTTPSSSTPTMSASLPSSSNNPRPSISSADACLSTGLSTSAINKLSQLSVPELLAYSNLSHDIRIPVVHIETGQRIDSDKAPTLKSLDQWLKSNQKYNVDLLSLATSHPSLFSATTLPTTSGQKTPISTPKPVVQKQTLDTVQKPVKQMEKTVPSITQPLIDKKSAAANAAAQKEAALQSSLASSLFGMPDLQSTSNSATTAAQMAALNQFLVGLTPSNTASTSQLQTSSNVASSQQQSPNLKSIEQQMLLLQQAMTLGGASNGNNPYAFLYQNPSDLFGMKPSQSFGLGQPAPSSTPSSSSLGTSVEQMSAALASAAAGFGTVKGATTTNQSDINALSAAALTSELYLTAMASSLQPFMGTTAVQSLTPSLMQQQQSASSSAASMAGMNEQLLQLLQAAGMDPLLGTTAPPRSSTTTSSVGGVLVSAPPKSSSSAAIGQREAKTAAAQSRAEDSSMGGVKKGTGGGKGLKLNAVLEKLNASSNQAGPPIPESQATSTTIAESEEKRGTEGTSDTK